MTSRRKRIVTRAAGPLIPRTVYLIPFRQLKEVPGVRVSSRWLRSWLLSLERAPEALLQSFDKGLRAERATGAGVRVQQIGDVWGVRLADEASPVGYQFQQQSPIIGVVLVAKKGLLASITALGHMMRKPWDNHSWKSRHWSVNPSSQKPHSVP
jgi:hypothetical protein